LVLIILVLIWAAVLLPPYLQNRSESRPADSISSFQKQLSVLERRSNTVGGGVARMGSAPSYPLARMSRAEARKRRRDVLFTLAGAAGLTFLMALLLGGSVWMLQLLCDVLLAGYVYLLAQTSQRAVVRVVKVRYLPSNRQPRHAAEPALLLRRSGS
jgi:hypothetical protein